MPSILDQRISLGLETVYGTAVAPTRSYEATSDGFASEQSRTSATGFRQGRQAQRADRDRPHNIGGAGSLEMPIFDRGMGLLLQHAMGSSTAPVAIGATNTYTHAFALTDDGPQSSYTVQIVRVLLTSEFGFNYSGCLVTGLSIAVSQGEAAMLTVNYDVRREAKIASPPAGVYVADQGYFDWSDATVSVDGTQSSTFESFNFDLEHAMATDLRFLKRNILKDQPRRAGEAALSGSITAKPNDLAFFDQYVSGDEFPLVLELNNGGTGSTLRSFRLTLPSCKFTGSSPVSAQDALTTQELPFTAFHDGTQDAVQISIITPDAAF